MSAPEDTSWTGYMNPDFHYERPVSSEDAQPPEETAVPPATPGSQATTSAPTPGSLATTSAPTPGSSTTPEDPQPLNSAGPYTVLPEETPSTAKKRGRPSGTKNKRREAPPVILEETDKGEVYPPTGNVKYYYDHTLSLPAELKKRGWDKDRAKKATRQHATWAEPRPRPSSAGPDAPLPSEKDPIPLFPTATSPPPTDVADLSSPPPPVAATALPPTGENSTQQRSIGRPSLFFPTATSPPPTDVAGLLSPPPPVAATTLPPTGETSTQQRSIGRPSPFFPTATSPPPTDVAGLSSPPPVAATTLPPTGENSTQQRRRGRPPKRPTEETSGQIPAEAGEGILPTGAGEGKFLSVEDGEDIYEKLLSFAEKVGRKVTVLCAVGMAKLVTMVPIDARDPSPPEVTGVLDILYLHGRLTTMAKDSSQVVLSPHLKIQFADPDNGMLKTGTVSGPVIALDTVEITLMVDKPPEIRPEKKQRKPKRDDPENPSEQKGKKQKKDPDMGGGSFNAESSAGIAAV